MSGRRTGLPLVVAMKDFPTDLVTSTQQSGKTTLWLGQLSPTLTMFFSKSHQWLLFTLGAGCCIQCHSVFDALCSYLSSGV